MARWNPFANKAPAPSEPDSGSELMESPDNQATDSQSSTEETQDPASESSPPNEEDPTPKKKKGVFGRFKSALSKTVEVLNTDIRDLVKEGRVVDDQFLDELFAHLVKTDMGVGPAAKIRDGIRKEFLSRKLLMSDLVESAKVTINEIMVQEAAEIQMAAEGPTVIMVVGVNGAGKTTSIAKLAHLFRSQGKSVVLGAGDTFRAAAVEQLTIWAERMGAEIITGRQGSDPASVAYKATEWAITNSADVCIVDTAGRLQTQSNLMDELGRIRRVISKQIPDAPHDVLLVLDATAGQNAISQARGFSEAAGCTGIILAKLDGSAKGGVAIPIRQEFNLPVKFVGTGETHDAFAPFDVQFYVDALFDEADE